MKPLAVSGERKGIIISAALVHVVLLFFFSASHQVLGYPMLSAFRRMSARSITTAPLFVSVNNSTTSSIPSNRELVNQRLQVAQAKKDARKESARQVHARNLHYKRMLHNSTFAVPPLYAVKVSVCDELRESLRLNGRERRGRVFVEMDSDASKSLKGLKQELHSFFRCLRKSTYNLHASLPEGT